MTIAVGMALLVLASAAACAKKPDSQRASVPAPGSGVAGQAGSAGSSGTGGPAGTGAGSEASARLAGTAPIAPSVQRPTTKEFVSMTDLKDVYFDFDKYTLRPGDTQVLDANAKWLKANENYLVLIEGHADERGTDAYNVALGERRAKATMNYLVGQGVQAGRMNIVSYGEERPVCRVRNEACWAKNRRAHFLVKPQ
jgi:peptidoglycan-associated lipoprotein